MEKRLLALTKRSLNASIVTTLVTLLGMNSKVGYTMERIREISPYQPSRSREARRRIRWVLLTMDDGIGQLGIVKTERMDWLESFWKKVRKDKKRRLKVLRSSTSLRIPIYNFLIKLNVLNVKIKKCYLKELVKFTMKRITLGRIGWENSTKLTNEIHEKDEKLKRYRRIGMKDVKEKEQLQKIVDSWKDSSKNIWRLINSGMSSNDKLGLGFEIQSNDEVLSYEEEMNSSVFKCSKDDSIGKPSYSRFTKTNDFKGVPPPLSGDYTPTPQEEIDDSLYVYGKKGPQKPEISVSDDNSSEHLHVNNEQ
ncbi:hypothetical protein Tco_0516926 [Tanacetum coccineum]